MLSTNDLIHKKLSAIYGHKNSIDDLWRQFWEDENGGVPIKGGRDLIDFLKKKGAAGSSVTSALRTYFAELNSVGAPSATKPMLLPLREWAVDQVFWLPGATGNYASIPDVNLLDADTAHLEQSVGKWLIGATNLVFNTGISTELIASPAPFGSNAVRVNHTGEASSGVGSDEMASGLSDATTHTIGVWVRASASSELTVIIRPTGGVSTRGDFTVGTDWQLITASVDTNTNGALDVAVRLNGAQSSGWFEIGAACIRKGSDPTFVPSTRIVGDLDLRAKVAIPKIIPERGSVIGTHNGDGTSGAELQINTDKRIVAVWGNGTSQQAKFFGEATTIPDGPIHIRFTLDVDNGASQHTVNAYNSQDGQTWSLLQTLSYAGITQVGVSGLPVTVGQRATGGFRLKSAIHSFELRDGIDGPVVASADFTDPLEVTGDTWTTPEGHAGTINRSGDATAELVDRSCWTFTGSEKLDIANRPELSFDLAGTMTFSVSALLRNTTTSSWPMATGGGAASGGDPGMGIRTTPQLWVAVEGGTGRDAVSSSTFVNDGVWHLLEGEYANVNIRALLDGLEAASAAYTQGDPTTTKDLKIGGVSGSIAYKGLVHWATAFRRVLTDTERAQLAAWDGSVENEPNWLRTDTDLVLYLNADDQKTYEAYQNDEVVDLRYV